MLTARSILFFSAIRTATQCSAALPTIATTITPTKNSERPIASEASEIEPTRISDISPTATPATGEHDHRAAHRPAEAVLLLLGVGRIEEVALCVRSEKKRPAT